MAAKIPFCFHKEERIQRFRNTHAGRIREAVLPRFSIIESYPILFHFKIALLPRPPSAITSHRDKSDKKMFGRYPKMNTFAAPNEKPPLLTLDC